MASLLTSGIDCQVEPVTGFDTDRLGTFTREIPRPGTRVEAARKKACIGIDLSGSSIGLASEGRLGPDAFIGMFSGNVERILWIDQMLSIEMDDVASAETNFSHLLAANGEEAETFAHAASAPEHGLVARPQHEKDPRVRKGIAERETLREAFQWACGEAANGGAFLEIDAWAHMSLTRLKMAGQAAQDLARKVCPLCPICDAPGVQRAERVPVLPCEDCGTATRKARADIHRCIPCAHQVTLERLVRAAPAGRCDWCNP